MCCQRSSHLLLYLLKFYIVLQWKNITEIIRNVHLAYFKVPLGNQDKTWASPKVCALCVETLRKWSQGKPKYLKFGISMITREAKGHLNDCYFCKVNIKGFNRKNKQHIKYFNWDLALLLVALCKEVPVSEFKGFPIFMTKFFLKFQQWMMKKLKALIWSSVELILFLESQ